MIRKTLFAAFAAVSVFAVSAAETEVPLNILADLLQVDPATQALTASGNVSAVRAPFRMLSDSCARDQQGVYRFGERTMFTTCTNRLGHLHWHVGGAFEYSDGDYALVKNGFVHFWEIPILWVPYLRMPLWSEEGLRIMPGYTGSWGAFLMTKYLYHLAGKRKTEDPEGCGLDAATRFDLRYEQGAAVGQEFDWRLGDFGYGGFKVYYAWDGSGKYDDFGRRSDRWHHANWGGDVEDNRYGIEFRHRWEISERDVLRAQCAYFSDSYFRNDFLRNSMFMIKNQFIGYDANEVAWEHVETWAGLGLSVSGPLNDFVGGTSRLPEFYLDVSPLPVFGLPVNYETENRVGYLRRSFAEYGFGDTLLAYSRAPGQWADYETARIDTYHRLTAPMKFADVLSVVPRLAFRGTFWGDSGSDCPTGWEKSFDVSRNVFRSILEGGITFSARGTADLGGGWRHTLEPYLDVLAQKAWYAGLDDGSRPYVFDALDASLGWSDQFASRGRNLPYSWYGLVPGVRHSFDIVEEDGSSRRYLDFDLSCVLQCNDTDWLGDSRCHKLAEPGKPNYGKNSMTPVPAFRLAWHPAKDTTLSGRFEYDADENIIAMGGVEWRQRLCERFTYYANVMHSDYRYWDFASSPFDRRIMSGDEFNLVHFTYAYAGFEHELCDAVAWSPFIRWDCLGGELDAVGSWIDFRTDCLGFRFLLEYEGPYTRIDGSERESDFSVGFYVYLRAFGADAGNLMRQ